MLVLGIRAIILYILVILVMRLMGKGEIGQLQPYEFVLVILLADLISVPMEDISVPLMAGIVPLLSVVVIELIISYLALKSESFRTAVSGVPSVMIEHGRIMESELRRSRITLTDLFEQLRLKGYSDISDVEFAIMETSGKMSVIAVPPNKGKSAQCIMPTMIILDGHFIKDNLKKTAITEDELRHKLRQNGLHNYKDVFFAYLESTGNIYVQAYERAMKGKKK